MNKPLFLMVILSAALSTNAFACGGEEGDGVAKEYYDVMGTNMTCYSPNDAKVKFEVAFNFDWGSCRERQDVDIYEGDKHIGDYADKTTYKEVGDDYEPVARKDIMLVKSTAETVTYKFAPEAGKTGLSAGLELTHNPAGDKTVFSEFSDRDVVLKSYIGTLSLSDRTSAEPIICNSELGEKNHM